MNVFIIDHHEEISQQLLYYQVKIPSRCLKIFSEIKPHLKVHIDPIKQNKKDRIELPKDKITKKETDLKEDYF